MYNGKPYRFFYGICSDIDDPECGGKIYKVDVSNGKVLYWMEENVYCAEAQFVPRPKHFPSEVLREDDGVLISSMIKGDPEVHFAGVVVLNATTMKEIGRAEFDLVGPAAKPLHGCFSPHKGMPLFQRLLDRKNSDSSSRSLGSKHSSSASSSSSSSLFDVRSTESTELFTTPSCSSDESDGIYSKSDASSPAIFTKARF